MNANFLETLMNARLANITVALSGNPWGGVKNTVRDAIMNFMGDFLVPIIGVGLVIVGVLQIPSCVAEHNNGHGQEFWKKIIVMGGCIGVGLVMATLWNVIRAALPA